MVPESVARLRDRIDLADIVAAAVVAGAVAALDGGPHVIGTFLGLAIGGPILAVALDEFDVDPALARSAFGLCAVAAGIVQLRDGGRWIGGALLAAGCWICLDGLYAWRNEDDPTTDREDDVPKAEVSLAGLHNRWLLEELRDADRPLTAAEIRDRTGLTEADFERLLEIHGESGPIERVGNGYAIDESETGAEGVARAVGRRLLRPIRRFRPAG